MAPMLSVTLCLSRRCTFSRSFSRARDACKHRYAPRIPRSLERAIVSVTRVCECAIIWRIVVLSTRRHISTKVEMRRHVLGTTAGDCAAQCQIRHPHLGGKAVRHISCTFAPQKSFSLKLRSRQLFTLICRSIVRLLWTAGTLPDVVQYSRLDNLISLPHI